MAESIGRLADASLFARQLRLKACLNAKLLVPGSDQAAFECVAAHGRDYERRCTPACTLRPLPDVDAYMGGVRVAAHAREQAAARHERRVLLRRQHVTLQEEPGLGTRGLRMQRLDVDASALPPLEHLRWHLRKAGGSSGRTSPGMPKRLL